MYERPANVFVAGFIGSPAMSFATMAARADSGSVVVSRGELSMPLTATGRVDGVPPEVIVGVRPEHARQWSDGAGLVGPLEGTAEFVEMLGRETLVGVVTAGDQRFTLLAGPDAAEQPGDRVLFGLQPGHVHLFDVSTEQALGTV